MQSKPKVRCPRFKEPVATARRCVGAYLRLSYVASSVVRVLGGSWDLVTVSKVIIKVTIHIIPYNPN